MTLFLYMNKEDQLELIDSEVKGAYVYVTPVPNSPQSTDSAQIRLGRQIDTLDSSLSNINSEDFNPEDLSNSKMGI